MERRFEKERERERERLNDGAVEKRKRNRDRVLRTEESAKVSLCVRISEVDGDFFAFAADQDEDRAFANEMSPEFDKFCNWLGEIACFQSVSL